MHLSQLGLEPRPNEAYLLPFKKQSGRWTAEWVSTYECVPVIDYRGKAKLARQSGLVDDIVPEVVFAKDHFRYEVTQDGLIFEHKPLRFRQTSAGLEEVLPVDRGPLIAAYAIAYLKEHKAARGPYLLARNYSRFAKRRRRKTTARGR